MFRALGVRVAGATARRAASAAVSPSFDTSVPLAARLGSSPAGTRAARLGTSPAVAVAGAARLGSSSAGAGAARLDPFSILARGVSTSSAPPGLTDSEMLLYKKLTDLEASHSAKMFVGVCENSDLDKDVTETSKLLGEHASACTGSLRHAATATALVGGLFVASALLLVYGHVSRKASRLAKSSGPGKSAVGQVVENAALTAEKAAVAAEKAAAAAEKATAGAEKATVSAEKAVLAMADAAAVAAVGKKVTD